MEATTPTPPTAPRSQPSGGTRSDLRVKRRVNWINKCLTQGEVYVLDFGSEVMYEVMEGSRVTRVYVRSNRLSLADALREAFPCVECGGRGGYAVADRNGEYDGEFSCFSCDGVRVPAMSTSGGQDNPWA